MKTNEVALNFVEYCFISKNDDGSVIGAINGRAYYNEVHIGDLIVDEKLTLTTFSFQAPEFYKKPGFSLEYVREDKDPKLSKYFFIKKLYDSNL